MESFNRGFASGCTPLQLFDGPGPPPSRRAYASAGSIPAMLSKLPPPWGPTVQQLLELEQRCRQLGARAITKRAKKIFTMLADRYRAEADSREEKEKEC
jgi:hypothetical protein